MIFTILLVQRHTFESVQYREASLYGPLLATSFTIFLCLDNTFKLIFTGSKNMFLIFPQFWQEELFNFCDWRQGESSWHSRAIILLTDVWLVHNYHSFSNHRCICWAETFGIQIDICTAESSALPSSSALGGVLRSFCLRGHWGNRFWWTMES